MQARPTALQRERLRLYARIVAAAAIVGALFGARLGMQSGALPLSLLVGIVDAVLIAGTLAGIEIFLLREGSSMRRLLGLPFVLVVALKTAAYGLICALVITGIPRLLTALIGPGSVAPVEPRVEAILVVLSLAMTLIFVVFQQAASLVGRRTFRNLVLGRYRRPRSERRFFLFVDVVGSTAIAERLGPLQAHRFLAAVYSTAAEPVAACAGEIYQYVGDEMVVTWTEAEGLPDARPLRCFFEIEAALAREVASFRAEFAVEPRLRGALHLGEVIAGEVGELRRAIVYHGDVMNTAARLEQATRDAGVRFIVSEAALHALGRPGELAYRDLGALALRGRAEALPAWSVDAAKQ
jgi:adenylate cyclase